MAGAFTHMAIVSEAKKSFPPGKKFGDIIHANLNFLTLGTARIYHTLHIWTWAWN